MTYSILVIEDDTGVRNFLKDLLIGQGFHVQTAADGIVGLEMAHASPPDVVLLDLTLPTLSGESVCAEIRKSYPDTRIVVLSAKDRPSDAVQALNLGADDYLTKPFEPEELLARIKARLKRIGGTDQKITVGDLELDAKSLEVHRAGKLIQLTQREFTLLEYLMRNHGQVLTREMILNRIWMYSPDIESRVVDVYIGYLRKKIDKGFATPLIHSLRGFGYTIKDS